MKEFETTYPEYINEVSEVLGKKRYEDSTDIRNSNVKYQRGDKELDIDILGIKGELIASHYLFSKNVNHKLSTLCGGVPVVGCDIMVNDKKIDVKSVPHYGKLLLVDITAHHKKPMDYYMFVKPSKNNRAKIWVIDYKEIGSWEKRYLGYGNAYCKEINLI